MKKALSSNNLKIIAVFAMVLDHIAFSFISVSSLWYFVFRIIGRITAPIMFMGIANGYHYTSNKFKYAARLLFFALISQIPYSLFMENKLFLYDTYNVLFTLLLGFLCLCAFYNVKNILSKVLLVGLCFEASYFAEYGLFGISLILMFSLFKKCEWKMLFYSLICFVYLMITTVVTKSIFWLVISIGLFLVVPLIKLYNGKKGKYNLKYMFYLFYPTHLLIFWLIKLLLG